MVKIMRSYTISEDNVNALKQHGGASNLVNSLLTEFFTKGDLTDIENIRRVKQEYFNEKEILDKKIDHLTDTENRIIEKEQREEEFKELEKSMRGWKEEGEKYRLLWEKDEISDSDYWKIVDERKLTNPKNKPKDLNTTTTLD